MIEREICGTCGAGLTMIRACIACREREGFAAYNEGKTTKQNPYNDADAFAWTSGWYDGLNAEDDLLDFSIEVL